MMGGSITAGIDASENAWDCEAGRRIRAGGRVPPTYGICLLWQRRSSPKPDRRLVRYIHVQECIGISN